MQDGVVQHTSQATGFSVVELLITVVLLGIMTGLGLATYQRSWEKEQLKAANRAAIEWLEDIRMTAVQQSKTCVITINDSAARLEPSKVDSGDNKNHCSDLSTLDLRSSIPNLTQLKMCSQNDTTTELSCNSSTTSGPNTYIQFTPRGTISLGGRIKLHASDAISNRCIEITQPLGLIRQGIENSQTCNYNTAF